MANAAQLVSSSSVENSYTAAALGMNLSPTLRQEVLNDINNPNNVILKAQVAAVIGIEVAKDQMAKQMQQTQMALAGSIEHAKHVKEERPPSLMMDSNSPKPTPEKDPLEELLNKLRGLQQEFDQLSTKKTALSKEADELLEKGENLKQKMEDSLTQRNENISKALKTPELKPKQNVDPAAQSKLMQDLAKLTPTVSKDELEELKENPQLLNEKVDEWAKDPKLQEQFKQVVKDSGCYDQDKNFNPEQALKDVLKSNVSCMVAQAGISQKMQQNMKDLQGVQTQIGQVNTQLAEVDRQVNVVNQQVNQAAPAYLKTAGTTPTPTPGLTNSADQNSNNQVAQGNNNSFAPTPQLGSMGKI